MNVTKISKEKSNQFKGFCTNKNWQINKLITLKQIKKRKKKEGEAKKKEKSLWK